MFKVKAGDRYGFQWFKEGGGVIDSTLGESRSYYCASHGREDAHAKVDDIVSPNSGGLGNRMYSIRVQFSQCGEPEPEPEPECGTLFIFSFSYNNVMLYILIYQDCMCSGWQSFLLHSLG